MSGFIQTFHNLFGFWFLKISIEEYLKWSSIWVIIVKYYWRNAKCLHFLASWKIQLEIQIINWRSKHFDVSFDIFLHKLKFFVVPSFDVICDLLIHIFSKLLPTYFVFGFTNFFTFIFSVFFKYFSFLESADFFVVKNWLLSFESTVPLKTHFLSRFL